MIPTAVLVATIRRLRHNELLDAAPRLRADTLDDLRDDFALWCHRAAAVQNFGSWQAAWNAWSRVSHLRPIGTVRVQPRTCPDCAGRRYSRRTFTACRTCIGGTRRPPAVIVTTRWIQPSDEQP